MNSFICNFKFEITIQNLPSSFKLSYASDLPSFNGIFDFL